MRKWGLKSTGKWCYPAGPKTQGFCSVTRHKQTSEHHHHQGDPRTQGHFQCTSAIVVATCIYNIHGWLELQLIYMQRYSTAGVTLHVVPNCLTGGKVPSIVLTKCQAEVSVTLRWLLSIVYIRVLLVQLLMRHFCTDLFYVPTVGFFVVTFFVFFWTLIYILRGEKTRFFVMCWAFFSVKGKSLSSFSHLEKFDSPPPFSLAVRVSDCLSRRTEN